MRVLLVDDEVRLGTSSSARSVVGRDVFEDCGGSVRSPDEAKRDALPSRYLRIRGGLVAGGYVPSL